ncbi:1-acyl-sn-glycerol-3-phosphate acyltransferase gamma-like [Asterias amurensis]|uniref:1-acyl-sn-glycerol-3-phosphate acyltransferase gamma-like n=1 Tax=Asterias amurensis TaxID=7602 RepID=UPI003AB2E25F
MGLLSSVKESPLCVMVLSMTFLISGIIVILLQLLTLFLVYPFSKSLYQVIVCKIIYMHWAQMVWLCDHWSGTETRLVADKKFLEYVGTEHAVITANHKEDVDWLAVWALADRFGILKNAKCLMKNDLKYVPLVGWSFSMLEMIFVKRDFTKDKKNMIAGFRSYITYPIHCMILMFCEGTRFTPEKHAKGIAFAKEKGLPELKHHLTPRTKGFVVAMEAFDGKVPAIYDLTFAVSKSEYEPTMLNLMRGKKFIFNFHAKRIPIEDVPKDEEGQVKFIHDLYKEKDMLYEHFVQNETFEGCNHRKTIPFPSKWSPIFVEVFWLSFLGFPALYYLITVLTTGSLLASATALGVVLALYILSKFMVGATMTSKGSTYGGNKHRTNGTSTAASEATPTSKKD